ncbi:unannotated protein [freshwater metagenome]|uniref:Unannotated protein n=1 Tax=freshwater metagenome TaxID=449393 RepID=A0A6J7AI35_9ZZZZ
MRWPIGRPPYSRRSSRALQLQPSVSTTRFLRRLPLHFQVHWRLTPPNQVGITRLVMYLIGPTSYSPYWVVSCLPRGWRHLFSLPPTPVVRGSRSSGWGFCSAVLPVQSSPPANRQKSQRHFWVRSKGSSAYLIRIRQMPAATSPKRSTYPRPPSLQPSCRMRWYLGSKILG